MKEHENKRWHCSGTADTPDMKTELCAPSERGRNRKHNLNISKAVSKRSKRDRNRGKEISLAMHDKLTDKVDRSTAQRERRRAQRSA